MLTFGQNKLSDYGIVLNERQPRMLTLPVKYE